MEISDLFSKVDRNAMHSYLERSRHLVNSELEKLIDIVSPLSIHEKIEYALLSSGKRLRPSLVLLSAECVGGDKKDVVKLATAIELMHTASLVHDDILDKDMMRRGAPTVQAKWSLNDAILVSDVLVALSLNLTSGYGENILKVIADAGLMLCEGEYLDIMQSAVVISEEKYLETVSKKCASLFRAASQVGAMAGGGSPFEVASLADFGEHYGMAFQLHDDLSDLVTSHNAIPQDLREGRLSLPIIHLYANLKSDERKLLLRDLNYLKSNHGTNRKKCKFVADKIMKQLELKGSIKYCNSVIKKFVDNSIVDVTQLRESVQRNVIAELSRSIMDDPS